MRILVVEDEIKMANALKKALEKQHYAVDVAYDGDEGYAMVTTEPYDAALIDRMLPGDYSGTDIVAAMRSNNLHTPVILLTALGTVPDKTHGLDVGADDYLVKPFALDELFARLRAVLRRPAATQSATLTVGDLSLDTVDHTVHRGDTQIQLTGTEFSLLEYLMRNHGKTVSKDTIIAHVWDFDADILPNTVEVYIKYLRNKVDAPFSTPLIHTVRGLGYRLEAPADV